MDYLSDEQIDGMFDGPEYGSGASALATAPAAPSAPRLYPLSLVQAPAPAAPGGGGVSGLATKQVGPLPLWAWLLLGGTTAGGAYFFYKGRAVKKVESNDGEAPSVGQTIFGAIAGSGGEASGGWSPSRTTFAAQLQRYYDRKGLAEKVVVWHDAEDAKKGGMSVVSPLINVQVKAEGVTCDTALVRFCRREGLNPVQHQDGSIGLYPHTTKRGKEWEGYVDALRDEGQQV